MPTPIQNIIDDVVSNNLGVLGSQGRQIRALFEPEATTRLDLQIHLAGMNLRTAAVSDEVKGFLQRQIGILESERDGGFADLYQSPKDVDEYLLTCGVAELRLNDMAPDQTGPRYQKAVNF